jgi:hypothetical protein
VRAVRRRLCTAVTWDVRTPLPRAGRPHPGRLLMLGGKPTPTLPGRYSLKIAELQAIYQPKRRSNARDSPLPPLLDCLIWHGSGTRRAAQGHYRGRCSTADQPEWEKPSWHLTDGNESEQGGRLARRNLWSRLPRKRCRDDLPRSPASGANEAADQRSRHTDGSARHARTSLIATTSSFWDSRAATLLRHTCATSSAARFRTLVRQHADGANRVRTVSASVSRNDHGSLASAHI